SKRDKIVRPVRAPRRVRADNSRLTGVGEIDVEDRLQPHAQWTGLKTVSPSNKSTVTEKLFCTKSCSLWPKNSALPGRAELTALGVGTRRASKVVSVPAVRLRKISWPMMGASPLKILCWYGCQSRSSGVSQDVSIAALV